MDNRRNHLRIPISRPARIIYGDCSIVDCIVCDLSVSGAGLQVSILIPIPGTFDLITKHDHDAHTCRVVWRTRDRMGVSFQ